jgi:S1-C subfamily serine protease
MNRLVYILAFLAILYGIYTSGEDEDGVGVRRPPPVSEPHQPPRRLPPPGAGDKVLAPPSAADPVIVVEAGKKVNSSGTAFALGGNWWLTARHVVDGCSVTGLLTAPRKGVRAREVHLHPNADVALLRVPLKSQSFKMNDRPVRRGQAGFSIGYPQGDPGEVYANLIGRQRLHTRGRFRSEEPALVWAEQLRWPDSLPELGGLSGGPMFNPDGSVVGVLVAASERRGRVITAAPVTVEQMLDRAGIAGRVDRGTGSLKLSANNFSSVGNNLRARLRIAKVICQVKKTGRRGS